MRFVLLVAIARARTHIAHRQANKEIHVIQLCSFINYLLVKLFFFFLIEALVSG